MDDFKPDDFTADNTDDFISDDFTADDSIGQSNPSNFQDPGNRTASGYDPSQPTMNIQPQVETAKNIFGTVTDLAKRGLESNPLYKISPFGSAQTIMDASTSLFNKAGQKATELMGKSNIPYISNPKFSAGVGTAVSMAPDLVLSLVGSKKAPGSSEFAQESALKAMGSPKRLFKSEGMIANAKNKAQTLLDQGIFKPFGGIETMAEDVGNLAEKSGQKIGDILKTFKNKGKMFDLDQSINELESIRPRTETGQILNSGEYARINQKIDNAIDTVKAHLPPQQPMGIMGTSAPQPAKTISFEEANQLKGRLQDLANYQSNKEATLLDKVIAGKFREAIDKSLENVSKEIGDPNLSKEFMKQKQLYSAAQFAKDPIYQKIASELANKRISLTDWILGSASLTSGNPLSAITQVGAKKLLEKFGNTTAAVVSNKLSKYPSLINPANVTSVATQTAPQVGQEPFKNDQMKNIDLKSMAGTFPELVQLTIEKAREYMKKAGGDRNKARELAAQDGHTWKGKK